MSDKHSAIFGISIHALREEGDGSPSLTPSTITYFYPRPPRGGRPYAFQSFQDGKEISIHALREEGDLRSTESSIGCCVFLSTPSARRATGNLCEECLRENNFYPRPPRGGRR